MTQSVLDLGFLGSAVLSTDGSGKVEAQGRVPENLELFQDHFPEFPVLPGVLILDIFKKIADSSEFCFNTSSSEKKQLRQVRRVKFTAFLKPGAAWETFLERSETDEDITWKARLVHDGQRTATAELLYRRNNL